MKRVFVHLQYFYDEESMPELFFNDEGVLTATDEEITIWAREMMLADITDGITQNELNTDFFEVEIKGVKENR